jgi:phosphomevalonate kinase
MGIFSNRVAKSERINQIISEVKRQSGVDLSNCLPIDADLVVGRFGKGSTISSMVQEFGKLTGRW